VLVQGNQVHGVHQDKHQNVIVERGILEKRGVVAFYEAFELDAWKTVTGGDLLMAR